MRTTKLLCLHLCGGVALLAAAAPGLAQDLAPAPVAGGVQVIAAATDKRATHLQRAPITIDLLGIVAMQDRAAPSGRTAVADLGLSRTGQR